MMDIIALIDQRLLKRCIKIVLYLMEDIPYIIVQLSDNGNKIKMCIK